MQPENRATTTREYFGTMNNKQKSGTYNKGVYQESNKISWKPYNVGHANKNNTGDPHLKDYSKDSYSSLPNSRNITSERTQLGIVSSTVKALMTPVLDVLKPTRKQNVIGNMRPVGNVQGKYGNQNNVIWNSNDVPKTTIKEQTENNNYITSGHHYRDGGYTITPQLKIHNQRDTTTCGYSGNPLSNHGNAKQMLYDQSTYTHINQNKEKLSQVDRYNQGNHSLYNANQNVTNLKNRSIQPAQGNINLPKTMGNKSTMGVLSGKNTRSYIQIVD